MSRSKPQTKTESIAKRYFEYNGKTGAVSYYDKDLGEKVEVELPMTFMVLDELATVRGWHDKHHSRIWSNEVRNTMREPFTLMTSQGRIGGGIYSTDIKGKFPAAFHKSIYIAYYEDDQMVIGNIRLKGSASQVWGDFCRENKVYKGAVTWKGSEESTNGAVKYYTPIFTFHDKISEESEAKAQALDAELQQYLHKYFEKQDEEIDIEDMDLELDEASFEEVPKAKSKFADEEIPF